MKTDKHFAWAGHLTSLRNIGRLLSMLWRSAPIIFVVTVLLRLIRASMPVALLWIPKKIIDALLANAHDVGRLERIWKLLALELALTLIADLLAQASTVLDMLLGERFTSFVATQLISHVAQLDLATLEDPEFYDKLERVRGQATGRVLLLTLIMNTLQETFTLITLAAGLAALSPWVMVIVVVSLIPTFLGEARFSRLSYTAFYRRTPQRRELEYIRLIGSCSDSAKEVRLFGLAPFLRIKYQQLSDRIYSENKELAVKRAIAGWSLGILAMLGYYAGYVEVLRLVLQGAISIGTFTFLIGSLARSRMSAQRNFSFFNDISEQAVMLTDLFAIFDMNGSICSAIDPLPIPQPIRMGFEFCDVSFSYPGSNKWVVRHINLRIGPNEMVVLLGDNGAGKSTIVKLLSRLYDPAEGCILLDGFDLRRYDLTALRCSIGAIFQDFAQFDLPVRENIGFGGIASMHDNERLRAAARKSGAEELIDRFPSGYDQMLGRRFKGGTEISGGEWQKIALARAFIGRSQLIILDEPTSSLDAEAEHELIRHLRSEHKGTMTVIVSHRLSAVRLADKIVVLKHGEILEEGTHDDLLELGGRYAHLFALQASVYIGEKPNITSSTTQHDFTANPDSKSDARSVASK